MGDTKIPDTKMGASPLSPEYFMAALTSVVHAGSSHIITNFENIRTGTYTISPLTSDTTAREANLPAIWAIRLFIRGKPWIVTIDDRVPFDVTEVIKPASLSDADLAASQASKAKKKLLFA